MLKRAYLATVSNNYFVARYLKYIEVYNQKLEKMALHH